MKKVVGVRFPHAMAVCLEDSTALPREKAGSREFVGCILCFTSRWMCGIMRGR